MTTSNADPPRIFTPEYYARMRELEDSSWWNAGMRDIAAGLLKDLALSDKGVVLDVGCGSGQTMSWFLSGRERWRAVGMDLSSDALVAARDSGQCVVGADARSLPFGRQMLDLLITLDVLQHLPLDGGDAAALSEFRRVLKPGGHLLLRTNAQAFPRSADDAANAFRRYDPTTLRGKLVAARFEVILLGRVNALLGLAEIPRELRARRTSAESYHGILSSPPARAGVARSARRAWLRAEGKALRAGWQLPFGRTIFALCRAPIG